MLISPATAAGIADGSVTLAFRRWDSPRMRPGSTQRTGAGVVLIETVDPVDPEALTEDDAVRSGVRSLAELRRLLARRDGAHVYRMQVRLAGPDPRVALREQAELTDDDRRALDASLDRMDAARAGGPWTREVLRLIAGRPGVRAPDLAASLGRETLSFKRDVRKLKELGLTHSLPVGYEISPRGRAYLG
ncbi:ASCH domain-containing protein [Blastococcus sp. CT_GayMR20]|uniref:ASCH domain-containing protein n=1 Tax=Blastococcus sp. CT_GayMR20 TaxID=2559609 RepID=UPI001ADDC316|nr:ASCH domain-containing protein [Blastococcus sp. CT_GayMR20]